VVTLLAAGACGGGDAGERLTSTTLTGHFKGQPFTPLYGVATVYQGSNMLALGDGPINCSSTQQNDPPMGTTATVSVATLEVGTYSSVFVDMIRYQAGSLDGFGSSDGTVTLAAVSATSVDGSITYSYTDTTTGDAYDLSGSFEAVRCPM
jgi:hypothetical protein